MPPLRLPESAVAEANATIVIAGSPGRQSRCEPWRAIIIQGLERGLTARRIWQDLRADHGFEGDYQSVQRFARRLNHGSPLPFRRMECGPGEEAQVDFGKGAPVDHARRQTHTSAPVPHRAELLPQSLQRSGAAADDRTVHPLHRECFLSLRRRDQNSGDRQPQSRRHPGRLVRPGTQSQDPGVLPALRHGSAHTRPYTPRHKGKIERGVGTPNPTRSKGRTFTSLAEQNRFLAEWESTVADTRIHGTTRKQVGKVFAEVEKPALLPLPPGRFPCFQEAQRIVNRDGHVEVAKAYYSAPPEFVGRTVWARWDGHVVRSVRSAASADRHPCPA
jgi:hypothetical protein